MKRFTFWLRLTLVILTLAFIWGNSMMPGDVSLKESSLVLELIRPVVRALQRGFSAMGVELDEMLLVRKLAHFSEYGLLGVLTLLLFLRPDGSPRYLPPGAFCLAAAGIDEGVIQTLATARGPALRDVAIDFCGACTGILGMALIVLILCALRPRRRAY